ncbi:hypothetical protein JMJ35_001335 [Cladonia borealis]|uniref:Ribonuclease H1 N-terminal domain-containing protein n=1 Tax=Cladonia borealis TaxID=184061 RepID=A0AA39V5C5_9LECA|nr:hypothetical protein JMJ35_001335 [Cladonia borealis]
MGKHPKVAYVVFKGYQPGVYRTWEQVDQQVKGFSNNKYKGYTEKDGGRVKAEEDYIYYAASNQLPGAALRTPPIKQNLKKKERPPSCGDLLGGELDDVMSQVTDANIASVDVYNADITTIADDDWEVVPVKEHDTDQAEFNIYYPVIDTLSEDAGDARGRTYLFQEQAPSDEQTASDKDSENSTDYRDFPESTIIPNE